MSKKSNNKRKVVARKYTKSRALDVEQRRGHKVSFQSISLCYNQSVSSQENLDRAFDLLFEAVLEDKNK